MSKPANRVVACVAAVLALFVTLAGQVPDQSEVFEALVKRYLDLRHLQPTERRERLQSHHRVWIPIIAVHEAYPGHHVAGAQGQ